MPIASPRGPAAPFVTSKPWSNWCRLVSATPAFTVSPRTEDEAVDAVRFGIANHLPVRAVGSSHSWTGLSATEGVQLDVGALKGIRVVDRASKRVAVKAGTTIFELCESLWAEGFSLKNQGDIDVQTIAGAVSTGTHGSGGQLGIISSCVRKLRLINGSGEIVEITEDSPTELRAAQLSLGMLGIILELEMEVDDSHYLEEKITYPSWPELVSGWDSDVAENRHSSWWWFPADDSPPLYDLSVPPGRPIADCALRRSINVVEGPARDISPQHRVNRNYLIYHGEFGTPFFESEIFVPAEHAQEAVARIRAIIRDKRPEERYPVQPRWVRGDDALLSPAYKTDSVGISVSGDASTDYLGYFRDVYAALEEFNPRMHWGKLHSLTRRDLEAAYPEFEVFQRIRGQLDPNDLFLNDYMKQLFA